LAHARAQAIFPKRVAQVQFKVAVPMGQLRAFFVSDVEAISQDDEVEALPADGVGIARAQRSQFRVSGGILAVICALPLMCYGLASMTQTSFLKGITTGFLRLDGGCGDTCGQSAIPQATTSQSDASVLEAYIQAAFSLTYDCRHPLRFPGPILPDVSADGGYTVCDEPELGWQKDNCTLFSFGIASDDTFESALSERYGCEVHEFDPTVNGSDGDAASELVHFHKVGCWSHKTNLKGIGPVDSIENLVHLYHKRNTRLSLKIDVEGSEWETFPAVPDSLLDRVDQLVLEIHTNNGGWDPYALCYRFSVTSSMVQTLQRLREKFYLFHYHANNCCDPCQLQPFLYAPGPVELSFVRKALVRGVPTGPFNPHEEYNGLNLLGKAPLNLAQYGWVPTYTPDI